MAVKFLMSHQVGALYVKDDVARFDAKTEKDLVDRKIAEKVDAKKPDTAPAA